jgi:hypothetical protein
VLSANKHVGENTSVPIGAGDAQHDAALDHELREDLPGATAEGLALFRRVDLCEAHVQALTPVGEYGDVVSIADRDDAPAEFGGVPALRAGSNSAATTSSRPASSPRRVVRGRGARRANDEAITDRQAMPRCGCGPRHARGHMRRPR